MNIMVGLIVLIVFMMILIASVILLFVMLVKKKRVQMKFVMPDKTIATKNLNGKITREQTFMSGIYFIDDSCILKKFWGSEIWYYFGNPNPINFNFDKNVNNIIGTKAQDLKTFHDSDLIQKLFSTDNIEKLLMMLMIANLVLMVVCIVCVFIANGKPVELSNTGNNTQLISSAVRIALTTPSI